MRIAYLAYQSIATESGVLKKIVGQLRAWQAAGHEAALFAISPEFGPMWEGLAELDVRFEEIGHPSSVYAASLRQRQAVEAWKPDAIYARFGVYLPGWAGLGGRTPLVLEINSDDRAELRKKWSISMYMVHRATRGRLLRRARGMVFVTEELTRRFPAHNTEHIVIANGVELDRFSPGPPPENGSPRLVFVGNLVQPWSGFAKLVSLARLRPTWRIDVVGTIRDDQRQACPANLVAHGQLPEARLRSLLRQADAAIGPLALYVKCMDEACPLKVREYLACGVPTIIAHRDTDFPPSEPDFLLRLPNSPANVSDHVNRIDALLQRWRNRRVPRNAIGHLDTGVKEKCRLEFLERIRRDWARGRR